MARVDYSQTARAYRTARTVPAAVLAAWTDAVVGLGLVGVRRVVDVGAGPGGFLAPLHDWFGANVVAVEPSAAMRSEAVAVGLAGRFAYVAGAAEALPLRDGAVDVAWLSTVIHQFDDLDGAADELRRVVRPGGRVLIRGFFAELPLTGLLASFPGMERAAATFPETTATFERFERAGFGPGPTVDVVEPWTFELASWLERVVAIRHTDSALRPLTDDEFASGVAWVRHRYEGQSRPIESDLILRLLVLHG